MPQRVVIGSETGDKKVTLTDEGSKTALEVALSDSSGAPAIDILVNGNKPFTVRVDSISSNLYEYTGLADPGTATSSASWRILRETLADGTLLYSNGSSSFNAIWDNRFTITFS